MVCFVVSYFDWVLLTHFKWIYILQCVCSFCCFLGCHSIRTFTCFIQPCRHSLNRQSLLLFSKWITANTNLPYNIGRSSDRISCVAVCMAQFRCIYRNLSIRPIPNYTKWQWKGLIRLGKQRRTSFQWYVSYVFLHILIKLRSYCYSICYTNIPYCMSRDNLKLNPWNLWIETKNY